MSPALTEGLFLLLVAVSGASDPGLDHYEARIRPLLSDRCYSCHAATAKSVKGGLKLDTRDDLLKGGDSGPVIDAKVPGNSLLLKAVRHADDVSPMPPKGPKLTDAQIGDLQTWIAAGAPMPKPAAGMSVNPAAAKSHWAFQPIPPFDPKKSIDSIVAGTARSAGLTLSPRADRRTLLRRVSIDLTGLPPTWDEIQLFEADPDPQAFRKAVDRLLASPRYGERWGRHWLDVARYADTKDGVLQYGEDRVRPFAYTYRDYVIRAFNEDLPFNRFVREQLAADQIEPKADPRSLAAMGFLTLGRLFDNNIHDVLDDRIDTVTRGLLGLTVSCSRCHDHKFDPVPTADYYSLYSVFASCEVPIELPRLDPDQKGPPKYEQTLAETLEGIRKMRDQQYDLLLDKYRMKTGDYLERVATTKPDPVETAQFFFSFAPEELRPPLVARWRSFLASHATPRHPVFGPWAELLALPEERFAEHAAMRLPELLSLGVNPLVARELLARPITGKADVARAYGRAITEVYERSKVLPPEPLNDAQKELWNLLQGPDGPGFFPKRVTPKYMSRGEIDNYNGRIQSIDKLAVKEQAAPPRAMALVDLEERREQPVFIRGNPSRPGPVVPRQFLAILSGEQRKPFEHGSGRLDLADAIVAPDNPLTARVLVNRIWMHHFGEPLVSTPSDFGLRTAKPVQQELLDHLAAMLIARGWSIKSVHRAIVLSEVYCQSSADRPDVRAKDPENKYLCRANRRRLDWESLRDGLLAASGRLDLTAGGRPVDVANDPLNRRRTVYGLVDRQSVPGVFRAFDFATPDQSVERRPQTTVPQQALFGLNSPFLREQALSLARRMEVSLANDPRVKVRAMYRIVLLRDPDEPEMKRCLAFVESATTQATLDPWAQLAQVLLLTNEFTFVD